MKNLENYGVQELNAQEIKKTDGGYWQILLAAIITDMLLNPSATADAWTEGYNSFVDIRNKH